MSFEKQKHCFSQQKTQTSLILQDAGCFQAIVLFTCTLVLSTFYANTCQVALPYYSCF